MNTIKNRSGNAIIGLIFILVGFVFLLGELFDIQFGQYIWPFFIIGPGLFLFVLSLTMKDEEGKGVAAVSGVVTMVGVVLLVQNVTGLWASWAYAWALVAPTSLGLGMMTYGIFKGRVEVRKEGWDLAKVGLTIFIVAAVFFELIIGVSGFGIGRLGWPVALIALGLFLLYRNFTAGWRGGNEEIVEKDGPLTKEEEYHVLDHS